MLSDKERHAKRKRLYNGNDNITSALKHSGVSYLISFGFDFHFAEPILERVTKIGRDRIEYEIFNGWKCLASSPVCGHSVLDVLVSLRVIRNKK